MVRMKNIKKFISTILASAMISAIPGIEILDPATAFAFEVTAVDGIVFEEVYDTVDDFVYETVEDYVYETVEDYVYEIEEQNSEIFTLTIGQNTAKVFGEVKENDVQPIIRNDRTMLPARFVAENLGAYVSWDGEARVVTIWGEHVEIKLTIDSAIATVNGVEEMLDSPAFIENDRTYTPVRFIAEKLGSTVQWDAATQTVIMSKPVNAGTPQEEAPATDIPAESVIGTLELNNVQYTYEAGGDALEYNEGAIGGMCISAAVTGPSNVKEVLIAEWGEEPYNQ